MVARARAAGRGPERGRLGREDAQGGAEVLRRDGGEGEDGQRSGEEGAEGVVLFVAGDGVVGGAGEVVRECCGGRGRRVGCWVRRRRWGAAVLGGVVVFGDEEGGFEDAGLDRFELDGGGEGGGELRVDFLEGGFQFPTHGHPFHGFEVVVLEEEEERRREQQGRVVPVELRLAELGGLVGRRLGSRVAGDGRGRGGRLGERCGWGDGGGDGSEGPV